MRCGIEELLSIGAAGWAVVATSSSTAAELALATGSAAAVSEDGLHLVDPDVAREAWVRPGVDLGVYRGIYLMPAGISFRAVEAVNRRLARDSVAEFPVPDGTRLRMRGHFREVFTGAMQESEEFALSSTVGRDVLVAQGFLVDVVSHIPPDDGESFSSCDGHELPVGGNDRAGVA